MTLLEKIEHHLQTQQTIKLEMIDRLKILDKKIENARYPDYSKDIDEWSELYRLGEELFGPDWY